MLYKELKSKKEMKNQNWKGQETQTSPSRRDRYPWSITPGKIQTTYAFSEAQINTQDWRRVWRKQAFCYNVDRVYQVTQFHVKESVRKYSEKCAKVHTQAIYWCIRWVISGSGLEVTWYFSLHFIFLYFEPNMYFFY